MRAQAKGKSDVRHYDVHSQETMPCDCDFFINIIKRDRDPKMCRSKTHDGIKIFNPVTLNSKTFLV